MFKFGKKVPFQLIRQIKLVLFQQTFRQERERVARFEPCHEKFLGLRKRDRHRCTASLSDQILSLFGFEERKGLKIARKIETN